MTRRLLVCAAAAALAVALAPLGSSPASALSDRWARWGPIEGTSNAFTTTMTQQAGGFGTATVRTDSRANVTLPSGQSTFLGPSTPPGAKYGTSAGQPYLNLRPKADTATTPSTTTYSFDTATPDTGWAFVLGDVDADRVRVSATDADGAEVPASTVAGWFRGTFNYAGDAAEVPRWNPVDATLTGRTGFADTNGASGWFEPTTPLRSLTLTFTREAGFPVYQTWFVSRARPVGGTVSLEPVPGAAPCSVQGRTVRLLTADGTEVARTTTDADGDYGFGDVATRDDWRVLLDAGDDCRADDTEVEVDNEGVDGSPASRADFTVQGLVPEPISGRVTDDDGVALPGVEVALTPPGGGAQVTTTTDGDGRYVFDDNPVGTGYQVTVDPPAGYSIADPTISGIAVALGDPSVGNDFELVEAPSVSGTVTGGGAPLAGVQVSLDDGGGTPVRTVTGADGSYAFERVPPGRYDVAVTEPGGYDAEPARTDVDVTTADVTGQDFALERPGAIGGVVTDAAGVGVPDLPVVVDGPGPPVTVTTAADGSYFVDGLVAGAYTVTPQVPDGQQVRGADSATVTLTAAGEVVGGQDFVLTPADVPGPTPTPTPAPTPPPGDGSDDGTGGSAGNGSGDGGSPADASGQLPDTGGPSWAIGVLGGLLVVVGAGVLAAGRGRPRLR